MVGFWSGRFEKAPHCAKWMAKRIAVCFMVVMCGCISFFFANFSLNCTDCIDR